MFPGYLFDHEHLSRAVCCRVNDGVNDYLPPGYCLRHPYLGRISLYDVEPRDTSSKLSMHSINWCDNDTLIEIIDGQSGKTAPR